MEEIKIAEMEYGTYKAIVQEIKVLIGKKGLLREQSHIRTFDTFHSVTGHYVGETLYLEGIITNDRKKARDVCYKTTGSIADLTSLIEQPKQEIAA